MTGLLYYLVEKMAIIHDAIMTWNDSCENILSDKELHFYCESVSSAWHCCWLFIRCLRPSANIMY